MAAVATALASAAASVVQAQEAPAPGGEAAELNEIVVTGSRIQRPDFASDSPTVSVSSDSLKDSSEISIDQKLLKMPQFVAGSNQLANAADVQSTPTNSPGIATANLRGLGANRTLVLLDGRRTQPANASMVIDLNTIPAAALDGVEIITGGAGSTYGADAVAGVVNFKLKPNFQGVTLDVQSGQAFHGDGNETQVSTLMGSNFADDKGNAMLSLSYGKRDVVYTRNRTFYSQAWSDPGTGGGAGFPSFPNFVVTAGNLPTQGSIDAAFPGYAPGEIKLIGTTQLFYNPGATTDAASIFYQNAGTDKTAAPGYNGPLSPQNKILANGTLVTNATGGFLSLPLDRYSFFSKLHYDLNEYAQLYGQVTFNQTDTKTDSGAPSPIYNIGQYATLVPVDANHPVPASLANVLASRANPTAPWYINDALPWVGDERLDTTNTTYEMLTGVKGKLGIKDWTYDLYGSHGNTTQDVVINGIVDLAAYSALLNAPQWGKGADYNNGRTGLLAHCTSGINPFVNTPVSQDCVNIVASPLKTLTTLTQNQAELDIQGGIAPLPAGDLRFAVGGDYRTDTYNYSPDRGISSQNIITTGVGLFGTNTTVGSVKVQEGYVELLVPVLKNLPAVKSLNLDGGFRHSKYDSGAGGVNTWKATFDWDVDDYVRFRGGRQIANRAPNISELFTPGVVTTVTWPDHDPCSNVTHASYGNVAANPNRTKVQALCSAMAGGFVIDNSYVGNSTTFFPFGRDLTVGNQNVKSETAKTWTGGLVARSPFESEWLRKLTLTVDFYQIDVEGAIAPLSTPQVYQQCLNSNGTSNPTYDPNNAYCQLIVRNPSNGFWLYTKALYSNLGAVKTKGWDSQLDWTASSDFGNFYANVNYNRLSSFQVQVNAASAPADYAGYDQNPSPYGTQFKWKLYTTVGYGMGPVNGTISWRHLPSVANSALITNPNAGYVDVPSYDLFDFAARWTVNGMLEVRGGIDNLFNKDPLRVGVIPGTQDGAGATDNGSYDVIGRRWYLGVTARF